MFTVIVISIVLTIILSATVGIALKFIKISQTKKKWFFTFISTLLTFPAMTYGGDVFVLPLPHILSILTMRNEHLGEAYLNAWAFDLPSFLITAAVFRSIAAIIFQENKLAKSVK